MTSQQKKLKIVRSIVTQALKSNNFYGSKLRKAGITSGQAIKNWQDFNKLPIITRENLEKDQKNNPPFGSNLNKPLSKYVYFFETSGTTTGTSIRIPLTNNDYNNLVELTLEGMKKMGFTSKDGFCHFDQRHIFPPMVQAAHKLGARVIPLEENMFVSFLEHLNKLNVTILQTTPTYLFRLMRLAEKHNINLKQSSIKKIVTVSEAGGNTAHTKRLLSKTWGAEVIDLLGSTEAESLAVKCKKTNAYHLLDSSFIAQVYRDGKVFKNGKGELLLTILWRQDVPIIRYRTDDFVNISTQKCPCGLTSPRLMKGFLGRISKTYNIQGVLTSSHSINDILRGQVKAQEYVAAIVKENYIDKLEIYVNFDSTVKYKELLRKKWIIEDKIGLECTLYPIIGSIDKKNYYKKQRFLDARKGDHPIPLLNRSLSKINLMSLATKHYITKSIEKLNILTNDS